MGSLIHYHAEMSVSNMTEAVLAELGTPHERVTFDIRVSPAGRSAIGTVRCPAHGGDPELQELDAVLRRLNTSAACLARMPRLVLRSRSHATSLCHSPTDIDNVTQQA